MDRLITYGVPKDKSNPKPILYILEVENGLACNCKCAECEEDLVAYCNKKDKDGNFIKYEKVPHFKHNSGKDCAGAYETTLHLLAKIVLQKTKKIKTPKYHHDYDPLNTESFFREGRDITFEDVTVEKVIIFHGKEIKPDAIGEIKSKKVFIEFAKTHFIDNDKKAKLNLSGEACIEIDINKLPLDETIIADFLNSDTHLKYWVTNPKLDKEYFEYYDKKRKQAAYKIEQERQTKVQKLKNYENHKTFKLLLFKNSEITNCPLVKLKLVDLKNTRLYQDQLIKEIIDGTKWNKTLYGKGTNGKWIFLNNEQIFIYPPDDAQESLNEEKMKQNNRLYGNLNKIMRELKNPTPYDCERCPFSVEQINLDGETYQVCKHPIS